MQQTEFLDYYELLQISPHAEPETIHRVFRMLAARHHPDNPQTGNTERFLLLKQAYTTLSHAESRAAYDVHYTSRKSQPLNVFGMKEFAAGIDGEENRRLGILCLLYGRRRTDPDRAGMSILDFEKIMSSPREHLMFSIWYLKEKEWIRQNEKSDFVISGAGVDHLESNLSSHRVLYNLLKTAESGVVQTQQPDEETVGVM